MSDQQKHSLQNQSKLVKHQQHINQSAIDTQPQSQSQLIFYNFTNEIGGMGYYSSSQDQQPIQSDNESQNNFQTQSQNENESQPLLISQDSNPKQVPYLYALGDLTQPSVQMQMDLQQSNQSFLFPQKNQENANPLAIGYIQMLDERPLVSVCLEHQRQNTMNPQTIMQEEQELLEQQHEFQDTTNSQVIRQNE